MEDVEAVPTPIYEKGETASSELDNSGEEITDFSQVIDKNYLFTFSKKSKKIIFRLQIQEAFLPINYELVCDEKYMKGLSKIFMLCSSIDEIYSAVIVDLKKYCNDIKIELINDKAIFKFILDYKIIDKKENQSLILVKKKDNLNTEVLNNAFIKIGNNQKLLEEKLEQKVNEINLITEKQSKLQEEFKQKLEEIEEIKKAQNEYLKEINENKNSIIKFEKSNKELKNEIDELKNGNNENKKNDNMKNIIEKDIINIHNEIKKHRNEINLSLINQNQDIRNLSQKSNNLQKSVEEINQDIDNIQEEQEKISSDYNDINKKLEEIELKIKDNFQKQILEENKSLKERINELANKYHLLDEKFNNFEELNNIPSNFEFSKTISTDLFKKNFYNNRACIFVSCEDNNVYIAFGESSLNLEGYNVIEDEKFTICKRLHENFFDSCRHYYDKENERDLIITASLDSHVKVVNFIYENSEIIIDLNFQSKDRVIINTAYIINDIILIPFSSSNAGTIKFYNMKEEYISELEKNVGFILGMNVYYEEESQINYILIANTVGILSYNMEKSSIASFIPQMTLEQKKNNGFDEPYVIRKGIKLLLIGPCFYYPLLYIWDFIKGDLIEKIDTSSGMSDMCLWNDRYAFAGLVNSENNNFILIDLKKGKVEKYFKKEVKNGCAGIKALKHESGNYLITTNMKGNLDLYVM